MDSKVFKKAMETYIEDSWESIVDDIARLVQVPSVEELDRATEGEPFGPGPHAALSEALAIADRMGFETTDVDGYLGFADMKGATDGQIAIIGHVDVVPAGPGWNYDAYTVSLREDYLIGRGVLDDKGPLVIALYAMKFWKDLGVTFPNTIRLIFGTNEETGMKDVAYYRKRYKDPDFLFTPDAQFPVCYGEKGIFQLEVVSAPFEDGNLKAFQGGDAINAVPGTASASVYAEDHDLHDTDAVKLEWKPGGIADLSATGRSAHAAWPEEGVSAVKLLADYLLDNGLLTGPEERFMEFIRNGADHTDGSGFGLACKDKDFGPLTLVNGTAALENGRLKATFDVRFPTSITSKAITDAFEQKASALGADFKALMIKEPFLVDPQDSAVQALLSAYREVTGDDRKPFTIGGGTYAREFSKGVSFGPEMPWAAVPPWAGDIHGPDEAISIPQLKTALKIYARALAALNDELM